MSSTDEQSQAKKISRFESEHVTFRLPLRAVLEAFISAADLALVEGWKCDVLSNYSSVEADEAEREDVIEISFLRSTEYKPNEQGVLVATPRTKGQHCVTRAQAEKLIDDRVAAALRKSDNP